MRQRSRPFGTWPSPLKPDFAAMAGRRFGQVQSDGGWIYWTESRPEEQGRQVIMRATLAGEVEEVLPAPFSARSRVHEYGGGEFLVADGMVVFVNAADQDLYILSAAPAGVSGQAPVRLTHAPGHRFADMALDRRRNRLLAVCERTDATESGAPPPENLIVAIALDGQRRGKIVDLVRGSDFYAAPRLRYDGMRLAWLSWDLPAMPWEAAALHVAELDDSGRPHRPRRVAGGEDTAAFQPEWAPDGRLYFVWDRSGWGNIHVLEGERVRSVAPCAAEFGQPLWQLGARTYDIRSDGGLVAAFYRDGRLVVGQVDAQERLHDCPTPVASLDGMRATVGGVAGVGGFARDLPAIVHLDLSGAPPAILRRSGDLELDQRYISEGVPVSFPGGAAHQQVHGLYYAPANARYRGPRGARPPALVLVHGGPTASADRGLKPKPQFYASRGFCVLDVDYAGSTLYGSDYRRRLDGNWGVADVADCAAAARFLADEGLADPRRVAIAGSSAGGYTVLMALATTDVFAAGSSAYGISDLELLLSDTHKFESGYLHSLLGTRPGGSCQRFKERSPLAHVDMISAPVVLFQGLEDKVVPPAQSRLIVEALRRRGIDVAYHEFAGEGHGFRRAATIKAVYKAELGFLQRVLGLVPEKG